MSVLRKLLEDAINNLERYILGVKSMTSKVKVVWIQSAHTSRLFDEMSGAVMADITHVNLGMFGHRTACVVSDYGGDDKKNDDIRIAVLENYRKVAVSDQSGCGCSSASCCARPDNAASLALGYSANDLSVVPEGADMGLGCGNPQAIASLKLAIVIGMPTSQ